MTKSYLNDCVIYATIFCVIYSERGLDVVADIKKNIVLRVDPEFHQRIKLYVTMKNTTLQEYIVNLIKKDMEQNKKEQEQ